MNNSTITFLLLIILSACQTDGGGKKSEKPPIPWVDISSVPPAASGSVTPLPANDATPDEAAAMNLLGIPHDGYVLSESKLIGAADLRLYTEQLHADATANYRLGIIWTDIMWRDLDRADAALDEAVRRENTWWNRNKDSVYFGGGFALGAITAILIVYGVNQAN